MSNAWYQVGMVTEYSFKLALKTQYVYAIAVCALVCCASRMLKCELVRPAW